MRGDGGESGGDGGGRGCLFVRLDVPRPLARGVDVRRSNNKAAARSSMNVRLKVRGNLIADEIITLTSL